MRLLKCGRIIITNKQAAVQIIKKDCHKHPSVIESTLYGFHYFRTVQPVCRNGRRSRLKICGRKLRVGSSPTTGIMKKSQNAHLIAFLGLFRILKNLSIYGFLRQPEQCVLKKAGEVDVSCFSVGVQPGRDCDVLADSLLSMRV